MSFILIVLTIICFFTIGFIVMQLFGFLKKESFLLKLSYSWGLGVGLLSIQMFFYSILKIEWSLISIILPWVILFVIFLFKNKNIPKIKIKLKLTKGEAFFAALILLLLFFTGFESVLRPVQAWDGWDNWIFRPKVFFLHNTIDFDYIKYTNDEYPLIIPLMGTFGYMMMGKINDTSILLLFFVFYLTLGGLFFSNAKKMFGTKIALLFTFLLLSLQNLIRHGGRFEAGQSDLALAYYIFGSSLLFYNFIKTKNIKTLIFLSIFLGITGQIKNEGMSLALIISGLTFIYLILWKKYKYFLLLFPTIILLATWILYKKMNNYPGNFLLQSGLQIHLDKISVVALTFLKECINIQNWNLLWVFFIVALVVYWKKLFEVKIFIAIFLLQLLSYFIIYIVTPYYPTIVNKLYIHLAPLALLIIAILVSPQLKLLEKSYFKK